MKKVQSSLHGMKALGSLKPVYSFGLAKLGHNPPCYHRVLPFRRYWLAIIGTGLMLMLFALPLGGALSRASSVPQDLFDLVFSLFHLFWALGWSVGLLLLLLAFTALLLAREVLIADRDGIELRTEIFGLGLSAIFAPSRICELEAVSNSDRPGDSWRGTHMRLKYLNVPVAFGSRLDATSCEEIKRGLQQALGFEIPQSLSLSVQFQKEKAVKNTAEQVEEMSRQEAQLVARAQERLQEGKPLTWNSPSGLLLITANLVPLGGVLWFGWQIGELFLLYWIESAIIGLFNVAKMLVIGHWPAIVMAIFFTGHFGAFMVGHLLFIYSFFVQVDPARSVPLAQVAAQFSVLWPAMLALTISHGFSFITNFMGHQEYLGKSVKQQMSEPYGRIFIMHITIILGGFLVMWLGAPLMSLILLVALKSGADLKAHVREHKANSKT